MADEKPGCATASRDSPVTSDTFLSLAPNPALTLYARMNGGFRVWDPVRNAFRPYLLVWAWEEHQPQLISIVAPAGTGKTRLLESTLTRAVIFSAMTTATAFGSLWLSHHPGTSSMGKLMALSLVCTMAAAVLFQPVLMGPPRQRQHL